MNHWGGLSIEYANQRSYLDDLFQVYPTIPEGIRDIDQEIWLGIERAFKKKKNETLSEVARKYYGSAGQWRRIYNANRSVIKNHDTLQPGTKLIIPD